MNWVLRKSSKISNMFLPLRGSKCQSARWFGIVCRGTNRRPKTDEGHHISHTLVTIFFSRKKQNSYKSLARHIHTVSSHFLRVFFCLYFWFIAFTTRTPCLFASTQTMLEIQHSRMGRIWWKVSKANAMSLTVVHISIIHIRFDACRWPPLKDDKAF